MPCDVCKEKEERLGLLAVILIFVSLIAAVSSFGLVVAAYDYGLQKGQLIILQQQIDPNKGK